MAVRPLILCTHLPHITATVSSHLKHSSESREMTRNLHHYRLSRRIGAIATMVSVLLAGDAVFNKERANGFDFGFVVPDQTAEEAESVVRVHAQALFGVKPLLESESWKEAQKELRRSSSNLEQDFYTIINSKPGRERPQLRKIYKEIFTNVVSLDYAARDRDTARVWECYKIIETALEDMLSRI